MPGSTGVPAASRVALTLRTVNPVDASLQDVRLDEVERGIVANEDDFALVLEIHGDAARDHALDLTKAPVGAKTMTDKRAHFQKGIWHEQ